MKAHHNEGFHSDLMIYFWLITLLKLVASFLRQKVAYFYEQSSRHVSSAVGAYNWNPWVHWNSTFFPGSSFQLGKTMCVTIQMHTLLLTDPFNQWNCWDTLCCILGSTWKMSSLYPPLPHSRNGGRKILYIVEKDKKTSCLNYYCSEKMYLCVLMWIFGRSCFMVILSSVPWPRLVIAYSASPSASWYFWLCTMVRYQQQNPN